MDYIFVEKNSYFFRYSNHFYRIIIHSVRKRLLFFRQLHCNRLQKRFQLFFSLSYYFLSKPIKPSSEKV